MYYNIINFTIDRISGEEGENVVVNSKPRIDYDEEFELLKKIKAGVKERGETQTR